MNCIISVINFDFTDISTESIIIAVVGYIIVFSALLIMYYIFNNLKKLINVNIKIKLRKQGKHQHLKSNGDLYLPGDVSAAISISLFLYYEQFHDEEDYILTIKKISKRYSPWSSKIYGIMDNTPR